MAEMIKWTRRVCAQLDIRGDAGDPAFAAAVERVLGVVLPRNPNTVAIAREGVAYWLGPDEWLFVSATASETALAAALREALGALHSSVTEVGGGAFVMELHGKAVRELLAMECPLDVDPAVFAPGACAQTRLAKAGVLLRPLEGGAMELIVRRSFADYLQRWLEDAAAEYGVVPLPGARS